jgi:hypothetical protein
MIGVAVNLDRHEVVREFFELFKTPWELYKSDRNYDVVLCDGPCTLNQISAKLVLIFVSQERELNDASSAESFVGTGRMVLYKGVRIPIYGSLTSFAGKERPLVVDADSGAAVAYREHLAGTLRIRFGYELLQEIRTLLTHGQPASNAAIPTLDLHISMLRDVIVNNGVTLTEIPPVPEGYSFIACLTHDVDHPVLRAHRCDGTMFGFLYRALVRSVLEVFRGRLSLRGAMKNWLAALKLPLVHLGLAEDFWRSFIRYTEMEDGAPSSFYIIPFKGTAGQIAGNPAPRLRAANYCARDIASELQTLIAAGCEIGLHGIDAWHDSTAGRMELNEIKRVAGCGRVGVRMHWLYRNDESAVVLEEAGASYDSTIGYNETVGFRAGTTQAFKPLEAKQLIELPLHIMDTALFFPTHLNLSYREAKERVKEILDWVERLGGVATINWHDRSIAPERLWGDFYLSLVRDLKNRGAWIATAADVVQWFKNRRLVQFDAGTEALNADSIAEFRGMLPGLRAVVHAGRSSDAGNSDPLLTSAALIAV